MPDDGFRYELVEGEPRKMASAGDAHGYVAMNFGASLSVHVKANGLGGSTRPRLGSSSPPTPTPCAPPKRTLWAASASRGRVKFGATGPVHQTWPSKSSRPVTPRLVHDQATFRQATDARNGGNRRPNTLARPTRGR